MRLFEINFPLSIVARRSISAKHNTDNNKNNNSFSKSFSNTKKEELMKVINEAKQKLENVSIRASLCTRQFGSYYVIRFVLSGSMSAIHTHYFMSQVIFNQNFGHKFQNTNNF